jgi:hypothetical protein
VVEAHDLEPLAFVALKVEGTNGLDALGKSGTATDECGQQQKQKRLPGQGIQCLVSLSANPRAPENGPGPGSMRSFFFGTVQRLHSVGNGPAGCDHPAIEIPVQMECRPSERSVAT